MDSGNTICPFHHSSNGGGTTILQMVGKNGGGMKDRQIPFKSLADVSIHLKILQPFFHKRNNFCGFYIAFLRTNPLLEKGV